MAFGDIIQSKTNTTGAGGGSTVTLTFDSTATIGNLLVGISATRDDTQSTPSGWSLALSVDDSSQTDNLSFFYKISDGTETSVTFDDATSNQVILGIMLEIEGPWESSPLDASNSQVETDRTTSSPSINPGTTGTLSQADEVAVTAVHWRCLDTNCAETITASAWGESFTEDVDAADLSQWYGGTKYHSHVGAAHKVVSATTALNPTIDLTASATIGSNRMMAGIVTFMKSGGAPTVSIPVIMHHRRQQGMS